MHRRRSSALRAVLPLACLLLTLALTGCEMKPVQLQLPTFFTAGVTEVWFWRLDETSQEYVRSGHLRIDALTGAPGRKMLSYTMMSPEGTAGMTHKSPAQVRGDSIIVELQYTRWQAPGWFRVSARNDSGESGLSDDEIYL